MLKIGRGISKQSVNFFHAVSVLIDINMHGVCHTSHTLSLKEENLEAFQYLHDGGFTSSLSRRCHSVIPLHQIIEMAISQSSKETGIFSGKAENIRASKRWTKNYHEMVAVRKHLNGTVRKNVKHVNSKLGALRTH